MLAALGAGGHDADDPAILRARDHLMSEHRALLAETASRAFLSLKGEFAADWQTIEEAGLPWVMASEAAGGIGGGFGDAQVILNEAGRNAVALPIAEAIIGAALLAETGLVMDGALTLAKRAIGTLSRDGAAWRFTGALEDAAFGQDCARIAAILEQDGKHFVFALDRADAKACTRKSDPADTPYDSLRFANAPATAAQSEDWTPARLFETMALARACQIGGAIDAALALSITHVNQRQQFGRPLAKFQAIQQQMAVLVEEGAAANAAAMAACETADTSEASFEMAAAKLRASMAAGQAATIAHQVHGAIGFTREYDLQRFTRRLWSWRSEYGNERHWSDAIGARAARAGFDGFWPALTKGFAA